MRVRLIGYWCGTDDDAWPDPADWVDHSWSSDERDLVADYLDQGFVPWGAMGISPCRLCGQANGSVERTDGTYLWPEGLSHYVRNHNVRLPVEVLEHIDRRYDEFEGLDVDRDWWAAQTAV